MKLTEDNCSYCRQARTNADLPMYRAQCRGCAVRSLAASPLFHHSGVDGFIAAPYRKALGQIFGDQWREGHNRVKAEHERIRLARATIL